MAPAISEGGQHKAATSVGGSSRRQRPQTSEEGEFLGLVYIFTAVCLKNRRTNPSHLIYSWRTSDKTLQPTDNIFRNADE
jgi:hypothetical protein